jgi:hypothetical protein
LKAKDIMKNTKTPDDKPKQRRRKAARMEHAVYARRSDARKRECGLTKVSVWLPHAHVGAFREMARSVVGGWLGLQVILVEGFVLSTPVESGGSFRAWSADLSLLA